MSNIQFQPAGVCFPVLVILLIPRSPGKVPLHSAEAQCMEPGQLKVRSSLVRDLWSVADLSRRSCSITWKLHEFSKLQSPLRNGCTYSLPWRVI